MPRHGGCVIAMAFDLYSPLKLTSWASARAGCSMRYTISSPDEMIIIFGSGSDELVKHHS
jgi:hypothetical protein